MKSRGPHTEPPPNPALRIQALESLLIEKGLIDPDAIDAIAELGMLATLEKLASLKTIASTAEIDARTEQWRTAYLKTPHGQPVTL